MSAVLLEGVSTLPSGVQVTIGNTEVLYAR